MMQPSKLETVERRVTCAVRLRPPSDLGKSDGLFNFNPSTRGIINIHNPNDKDTRQIHDREFLFDSVFDWTTTQENFQLQVIFHSTAIHMFFS